MKITVAIQPDNYTDPKTPERMDSSSPKWAMYLKEHGIAVRQVNVYSDDILDQVRGCQGFMWRWGHASSMSAIARRILPVLEKTLGMVVYPDQTTCWHFDDKIAQYYLLKAAGIPTPPTRIFYSFEDARQWLESADFPLVLKLSGGAGASNVCLLRTKSEAISVTKRLFSRWHNTLPTAYTWRNDVSHLIRYGKTALDTNEAAPSRNEVLFQQFLPDNEYDTRVTVIGNRAFAFRRLNRRGDFRASGSGLLDYKTDQINVQCVHLAFETSKRLKQQSCAVDFLVHDRQLLVSEISYTYASWAIAQCPGHWIRTEDSCPTAIYWKEGKIFPEKAQIDVFLNRLHMRIGKAFIANT